jgi:hypothetical protein
MDWHAKHTLNHDILMLRNAEAAGSKREVLVELSPASADANLAEEIRYPGCNKQGHHNNRQACDYAIADHAQILHRLRLRPFEHFLNRLWAMKAKARYEKERLWSGLRSV